MTIERPTAEEIEAARARDAAVPRAFFLGDDVLDEHDTMAFRDRRMLLAEVNRLQQLLPADDDFRRWPGMDGEGTPT